MSTLRAHLRLLRWLGPWADQTARPRDVERRTVNIAATAPEERAFDAWVYTPARGRIIGNYLVCPGLHYLGPADPRFDRFAAVLASAGIMVLAPFLPDYLALRVDPRVVTDLDRAFAALLALPDRPQESKPGLFSISFGSLPTLRLASSARRRHEVGAVLVFGGYADWSDTVRFCLGVPGAAGGEDRQRDPLNQPVVLMNLIDDLSTRPGDSAPLLAAWKRYVEATWGRPEMKLEGRWRPVAEQIAAELEDSPRALFRIGVGLDPGAGALCDEALRANPKRVEYLDPRPELTGITCPVVLCHGADDDVIPHTELAKLARALPAGVDTRAYVTGLYHHTGTASLTTVLANAGGLVRELRSMIGILRSIVRCARVW